MLGIIHDTYCPSHASVCIMRLAGTVGLYLYD